MQSLTESRLFQKNDSLATTLQFPSLTLSLESSLSDEDRLNQFLLLQRDLNFLHRQQEENRFIIDRRAKRVKELQKEVEMTKDRIIERKTFIMKNKEKMEQMKRREATQSARIDRKIKSLRRETRELCSQIRRRKLSRKLFSQQYQPFYGVKYFAPPEFDPRPSIFHQQHWPEPHPNHQLKRGNIFVNPQLALTKKSNQKKSLKQIILDPKDLEKAQLIQAANLIENDIIQSEKNSLKTSINYKVKVSSNPVTRELRSSQNRSSLNSSQEEGGLLRQSSKTWIKDQEDEILLERMKGKIISQESYDLPQKSKSQMNSNEKSSINVVYQNSEEKQHSNSSGEKEDRQPYSPYLSPNMVRSKGMKQSKIEINVLQSLVDEFELSQVSKHIRFTQEIDVDSPRRKQIRSSQLQIKEVLCYSQTSQVIAAPPNLTRDHFLIRDDFLKESMGIQQQKAGSSLQGSITFFEEQSMNVPEISLEIQTKTPNKLFQAMDLTDDDEFLSTINLQAVSKISRSRSSQEKIGENEDAEEAAEMLRQSQEKPSVFMKKGSGVKTAKINRSPSILRSELSARIDQEEEEEDSDVQKAK